MPHSNPPGPPPDVTAASPGARLRRWLPLAGLAAALLVVYATGAHRLLSFKTLAENYAALTDLVQRHFVLALAGFAALYVLVVALSLPGGLIMTLSGGLLFGWQVGALATVLSATIGATALFVIARSSLGESLSVRAGPWLAKLREGFAANAFNYLLFLRLVPAFPFFIVNLAPAFLGVPLSTFVGATLIGIIPATVAFSYTGAGLGSVIEAQVAAHRACLAQSPANAETACPLTLDTSALVTPQLLVAFALLAAIALLPVVLKRMRAR